MVRDKDDLFVSLFYICKYANCRACENLWELFFFSKAIVTLYTILHLERSGRSVGRGNERALGRKGASNPGVLSVWTFAQLEVIVSHHQVRR